MARKQVLYGDKPARQSTSKVRGFVTVSVRENEERRTKSRLFRWCDGSGYVDKKGKPDADSAINALLDLADRPPAPVEVSPPVTVKVPWEAIMDAIRARFGAKGLDYHKLEEALRDAGMPD